MVHCQLIHRRTVADPDAGSLNPVLQHGSHLGCPAAGGKNPAAPFHHQFQSQVFQKFHQLGIEKATKSLVEEFSRPAEMGNEISFFSNIGEVAAALAGNAEFEARMFHLLVKPDFGPGPGRLAGSHHPGRTPADDKYFSLGHQGFAPYVNILNFLSCF